MSYHFKAYQELQKDPQALAKQNCGGNKMKPKKPHFDTPRGMVFCTECGVYFNYDIARDRQYDCNKRIQEVRCPCCKSMYEREK